MEHLSLYVVTWNVATHSPTNIILDELLDLSQTRNKNNSLPDFYIIGLQEVKSQPQNFVLDAIFDDPWTAAFKEALRPHDYVKIKTSRLIGLVLNVFCLRKHIVRVRSLFTEQTKTGLLGLWGNKGAVTARFEISGCSLCLVNSHLAPHDKAVRERIEDYNSILQSQKFPVKDAVNILFHDYTIWFGDLNFRLDESLSAEDILRLAESDRERLLKKDELKMVMKSGEAFGELEENGPAFRPTYKFGINSQNYDMKRRPAWTDRILYRVNKLAYENVVLDLKQTKYTSVEKYAASDHKPVVAEFSIKVFSNFNVTQVSLEPLGEWRANTENKVKIVMDSDVVPSPWDWVGIYWENFTSLDEYTQYAYLSSNDHARYSSEAAFEPSPDRTYVITFTEVAVRSRGTIRLLYLTHNSYSVLGMSPAINVISRENGGGSGFSVNW